MVLVVARATRNLQDGTWGPAYPAADDGPDAAWLADDNCGAGFPAIDVPGDEPPPF